MKLTEKSPSVLGKEIISDSKGSLGIKSSGCPNNEMQIRKKLNKNFFMLFFL
jgi:hypothetical protein